MAKRKKKGKNNTAQGEKTWMVSGDKEENSIKCAKLKGKKKQELPREDNWQERAKITSTTRM